MAEDAKGLRPLVVHFAGGTEISIRTSSDPKKVFEALAGDDPWLVIEDDQGERHYLAVGQIAYLTFGKRKGIGFS
jgi:hypothetical protein